MDLDMNNQTQSEMRRRSYQMVGAIMMGSVILIVLFSLLFLSGVFVGGFPVWLVPVAALLLAFSVYYLMLGLRRQA